MVVKLSGDDVASLKKQGYTDADISKAVGEIEREELQGTTGQSASNSSQSQTSAFAKRPSDDIARYQLELNDLLEQTEHILKGDVVEWKDGKKVWGGNPNPDKNPLNTEGIRKIMLELQSYINRHIILGDYDEADINRIMRDYGRKLSNFVFMKYEEMGMDTESKRQEYATLVMNIINLVYASYSRAKDGGERRSLREMISINQTHQSQGMGIQPIMNNPQQRSRGILNPMRYVAGKYV